MVIVTPADVKDVAWEGELVVPAVTRGTGGSRPIVTIGRPEIWTVADALESETGKKWVAPLGDAQYWLVRLACTVREPAGLRTLTEAMQTLYLRPRNSAAPQDSAYALRLFPERLGIEDKAEFSVSLGPELSFADGAGIKVGEVGAKIEYRKVFPVIQGYGTGEATPYWVFKPHSAHPLLGSQCVYAVLVARTPAGGLRASVEVTVTAQNSFGQLVRFGTPEEAKAHTRFDLP